MYKLSAKTSAINMSDTPTLMEPMFPEEGNKRLEDLATELVGKGSFDLLREALLIGSFERGYATT